MYNMQIARDRPEMLLKHQLATLEVAQWYHLVAETTFSPSQRYNSQTARDGPQVLMKH
jgi:hypothetical protein